MHVEVKNDGTEVSLLELMNDAFFGANCNFDACFHSLRSKHDGEFLYYLSRLLHIEMDDFCFPYRGRLWVLYINNNPHDWDDVVQKNIKV